MNTHSEKIVAPYGEWVSPINAADLGSKTIGLSQPKYMGEILYFIESRPHEEGRSVIVRRYPDGRFEDAIPVGFSACSRVHEYGGGDYLVLPDHSLVFSNKSDQRLYLSTADGDTRPITSESQGKMRFADGIFDRRRNRLIMVAEEHLDDEVVNRIVAVSLEDENKISVLCESADFYAWPRLSPSGKFLCWIEWNHPNLPWDETSFRTAELGEDGASIKVFNLGFNRDDESVVQPEWGADGTLFFVSDAADGFWNIAAYPFFEAVMTERGEPPEPQFVTDSLQEYEFAHPQWVFGVNTFSVLNDGCILAAFNDGGVWSVALISRDMDSGELDCEFEEIETPYSDFSYVRSDGARKAAMIVGSPVTPRRLVELDLFSFEFSTVKELSENPLDEEDISVPQEMEFYIGDALGNREMDDPIFAHAFFYPPQNSRYVGPVDELPPLLVFTHGGPTAACSGVLSLGIQYWTTRGFAVVDVNYRGSTGFGRHYRNSLRGKWGIADVEDAENAARQLAAAGLVDGSRMAIRGGSAGGYTTLAALTFGEVFMAGASHYGIGDLEALARDTHKFESRYLDGLVGPYPDAREVYEQRSPIKHTDLLNKPIILLQGSDDRVVPPNQAQMMVDALDEKGVPVAYLLFDGEGHGFRNGKNIVAALEAELSFYGQIMGFVPGGEIPRVAIRNFSAKT